ncbi:hypothetical protein Tco_1097821 [Tanacetum coccineum]
MNDDDSNNNNNNNNTLMMNHGGSISRAKYKMMSPAKLPISRSSSSGNGGGGGGGGITIPPGLSPTSFLESPVLLTNVKVMTLGLVNVEVLYTLRFVNFSLIESLDLSDLPRQHPIEGGK